MDLVCSVRYMINRGQSQPLAAAYLFYIHLHLNRGGIFLLSLFSYIPFPLSSVEPRAFLFLSALQVPAAFRSPASSTTLLLLLPYSPPDDISRDLEAEPDLDRDAEHCCRLRRWLLLLLLLLLAAPLAAATGHRCCIDPPQCRGVIPILLTPQACLPLSFSPRIAPHCRLHVPD